MWLLVPARAHTHAHASTLLTYQPHPAVSLPGSTEGGPRAVEWRPGYCVTDRQKIPSKHPCDQREKTPAPPVENHPSLVCKTIPFPPLVVEFEGGRE